MLDRHVAARHLLDRLAVKRCSGLPVDWRCRFVGIPAVALGTLIALAILAPPTAASAAAATPATTVTLLATLFAPAFASLGGRVFAILAERLALGLHRLFTGSPLVRRDIVSIGGGVGTVLAR